MEIEDEEEIKKYFNTEKSIKDFIRENLIEAMNIKTKRKKYTKENFIIDIDQLDFGYNCIEIELMVEREEQIKEAEERIVNLAQKYNLKKGPSKRNEYFRIVKPDIYEKLFGKNSV